MPKRSKMQKLRTCFYFMISMMVATCWFPLAASADEIDLPVVKPTPGTEAPYAFPVNNGTVVPICYKDNKPTASVECQTIAMHNLTYWPLHYVDGRSEFLLVGLTHQYYGVGKPKLVRVCGVRYVWKAEVDGISRRITFYGQGTSKVTIPWAMLFDDAQDQSNCARSGSNEAASSADTSK